MKNTRLVCALMVLAWIPANAAMAGEAVKNLPEKKVRVAGTTYEIELLQVPAGKANPSPPIGPALGQRGLNIMEFCKAFNAKTAEMEKGQPTPVVITIYADKSFTFETRTPPVTYFIKKAVGLKSGSKLPGKESAGTITQAQIREIAEKKMPEKVTDFNCSGGIDACPHRLFQSR